MLPLAPPADEPLAPPADEPLAPRAAFATEDPRARGAAPLGVVAFYYPDRDTPWDAACGARFLGNFHPVGAGALAVTARGVTRRFGNAESAFQALKFWDDAARFARLSGGAAFALTRSARCAGREDRTYAGFGGNWAAMRAVLAAKFARRSRMADALLATGDAFLLEHNERKGRDDTWSDDADGEGQNWLGLLLMLQRDALRGARGPGAWTCWIREGCGIDLESGPPRAGRNPRWQEAVRRAARACGGCFDAPREAGGGPTRRN